MCLRMKDLVVVVNKNHSLRVSVCPLVKYQNLPVTSQNPHVTLQNQNQNQNQNAENKQCSNGSLENLEKFHTGFKDTGL